jgi:hypothetical protein
MKLPSFIPVATAVFLGLRVSANRLIKSGIVQARVGHFKFCASSSKNLLKENNAKTQNRKVETNKDKFLS